ncbi:MAG TPA: hypothetical protein PKH97_01960 [Tetrasphaera sp.]|uniref:hypothetical protein n=1 Tax=Nostocoides sp. TaxID=1917966 RepID=UPI002C312483|nr:hypothetical protein [Tetrasphaera sp.]HNQ05931.1 hypothetical protein [Tetrasphaera sp.]
MPTLTSEAAGALADVVSLELAEAEDPPDALVVLDSLLVLLPHAARARVLAVITAATFII